MPFTGDCGYLSHDCYYIDRQNAENDYIFWEESILKTAIVLFIAIFTFAQSSACTVFKIKTSATVFVGSNEDWPELHSCIRIWFTPHSESRYAASYFGFASHNGWAQSGFNECGLFYDSAESPVSQVGYSSAKETLVGDIFRKLMEECASVDEAVVLLNTYNWTVKESKIKTHFIVVDASGASAVFEWNNGVLEIIRGDGQFQLMTNFSLSRNGSIPSCQRYNTCLNWCSDGRLNSIDGVANLLSDVTQNRRVATIATKIYDLSNAVLYLKRPLLNDSLSTIELLKGFTDSVSYFDLAYHKRKKNKVWTESKQYLISDTVFMDKYGNPTTTRRKVRYFRVKEKVLVDGVLLFQVKYFHKNGIIQKTSYSRTESEIILGYLNNQAVQYYPNGTRKSDGFYVDNRKNGLWTYWKQNGEVERYVFYNDDVVVPLSD